MEPRSTGDDSVKESWPALGSMEDAAMGMALPSSLSVQDLLGERL